MTWATCAEGALGISLTPRQREVIELVCAGHTNEQIGQRLGISEHTVETHLERLFRRYGIRSRAEMWRVLVPKVVLTRLGGRAELPLLVGCLLNYLDVVRDLVADLEPERREHLQRTASGWAQHGPRGAFASQVCRLLALRETLLATVMEDDAYCQAGLVMVEGLISYLCLPPGEPSLAGAGR